jgi:uncharacterized membrane protein
MTMLRLRLLDGDAAMDDVNTVKALEPVLDYFIRIVGSGIELFGVVIIVTGIAWSTYRQLRQPISLQDSNGYKIRIGRSLLLGLEVFVAADIIKTVAHELTFLSLGLLAGLVLVRTFLSWTLSLEIEGRWPWQREPSLARDQRTGSIERE